MTDPQPPRGCAVSLIVTATGGRREIQLASTVRRASRGIASRRLPPCRKLRPCGREHASASVMTQVGKRGVLMIRCVGLVACLWILFLGTASYAEATPP